MRVQLELKSPVKSEIGSGIRDRNILIFDSDRKSLSNLIQENLHGFFMDDGRFIPMGNVAQILVMEDV